MRNTGALLQWWRDKSARGLAGAIAAFIPAIAVLLVFELFVNSASSRHRFGSGFFLAADWDPVQGCFGALPFLYGTLVTSALGLALAIPFGVGSAIFLAELAPRKFSDALTFAIELLAAVPSVIYGLIGMFIIVPVLRDSIEPWLGSRFGWLPLFAGPPAGIGFLAAGVILAIMIVPLITSVSRKALRDVPRDQREAGLALGATRWETTWHVVVPFARLGIFGSIFLALARALGETMAVTMVIGNSPRVSASLFAPGSSISAIIANEFTNTTGQLHRSALIELGVILFALTLISNTAARVLIALTGRTAR